MKKQTEETILKRQIKEWLDWHGWFNFHYPGSVLGYKGAPDRIAIKAGIVLFIEVKSIKGKLTEAQQIFQDNIHREAGYYIIVKCLDDLINYIKWIIK